MRKLHMSTSNSAPTTQTAGIDDCPGNYVASQPTTLRCARCTRPLLVKDAKRTPTGYVCPYYVKARVATFYNANALHHVGVGALALVGGLISGFAFQLIGSIGFFSIILTTMAAPAIGAGFAEVVRRIFGKTRGQYFWLVATICIVLGASPIIILPALLSLLSGSFGALWALIPIAGLVIMLGTVIARMRI
jgi:hypothetical protein